MTNAGSAARRARAAKAELDAAHFALERDALPIRASFRRHPVAWTVAGGLLGGFVVGELPPQWRARIRAVVGGSALLMRSLLTSVIAGTLLARARSGANGGRNQP